MIVREVLKKLEFFSGDMQVLVQGYEDGFDSLIDIRQTAVKRNHHAREWNGEYEELEKGSSGNTALVLLGNRR